MNETDLHFFIDSTLNYFREVTNEKALPGIPYIKGKEAVALEFTGIIGISGKRKGVIYITITESMIQELVGIILGVSELNLEDVKDLTGEIANTIAGNVREAYGSSFLISVPVVVEGIPKDIRFPQDVQTYVVPITWKEHKCFLVVCLE